MNGNGPGESTDYQHRLVDHLPSMLAYWGRDLRCRFANQAYRHWFGVDPSTLVGTSLQDLLGPALFALNEPYVRAVLRGEEQLFERSVPGPGGITRESLANYVPDIVDGVVVGFLVQVTDVTSLKAAQAAMKLDEEYLRELFRQSHEGILVTDQGGRYIDVNESCCAMLGYARSEIIGRTFEALLMPAEIERLPQARAVLLAGGRHGEEWLLRRKDGTALPVELRAKLLSDGRRVGFLLDVSDHKRALAVERAMAKELELRVAERTDELRRATDDLQLSEARLRGIFDSASEGIVTTDENQIIIEANAAAARIFRCEVGQMRGTSLERFIPERYREAHVQHVRAFAKSLVPARPMGSREVSALRANGEEFPIETSISQVTVGHHRLFTVIHHDITARKEMMTELQSAHRNLQDLIAAMDTVQEDERRRIAREIHDDLQQTLAAIRMNIAAMVEARTPLPPDDQDLLAKIEELAAIAMESTRRIIRDLRPQVLEDLGLVPALVVLARDFDRHHGVACRFDAASAADIDVQQRPAIATCLFRVAQEALNNVARHANASQVDIELRRTADDHVVLSIRDNGVGLLHSDTRRAGSFGLMGMRERARALGGVVKVSGAPGHGTTVEVTLPITDAS
jgi:PAS domain S-box-containing protein